MMEKLANLDRRVIFLGVALVTLWPLLRPYRMPVQTTPEVKSIFDKIDSLPSRAPLLLSMDFDPASAPELQPMAKAILRQAFRKDLRVIGVSLWATSVGLVDQAFNETSKEFGKENGKDWCFLGFQSGGYALVIRMGQNVKTTFATDNYGQATATLAALEGVNSLKDIAYHVEIAAGEPGISSWYFYGKERNGYDMGAGCTSVGAPEWYPFLQTKQLNGLIGGMRGAAEYEALVNKPEMATDSMSPLSAMSLLVIVLVVFGNVMFALTRPRK